YSPTLPRFSILLFFHYYHPHPHLHSFPTRRSSDLPRAALVDHHVDLRARVRHAALEDFHQLNPFLCPGGLPFQRSKAETDRNRALAHHLDKDGKGHCSKHGCRFERSAFDCECCERGEYGGESRSAL